MLHVACKTSASKQKMGKGSVMQGKMKGEEDAKERKTRKESKNSEITMNIEMKNNGIEEFDDTRTNRSKVNEGKKIQRKEN